MAQAARLATARSVDVYLRPRGSRTLAPATVASNNPLYSSHLTPEMHRRLADPAYPADIIWGNLAITPDEARSIFERDDLIPPPTKPAPDPGTLIIDDLEEAPTVRREDWVGLNEAVDKAIEALSKEGCKVFFAGTEVTETAAPDPTTQKADGDWFPLQGRLTLEQVEQLRDLANQNDLTSDRLIAVARKLEEWGVTVV